MPDPTHPARWVFVLGLRPFGPPLPAGGANLIVIPRPPRLRAFFGGSGIGVYPASGGGRFTSRQVAPLPLSAGSHINYMFFQCSIGTSDKPAYHTWLKSSPRSAIHNNIMSPCRNAPLSASPSPPTAALRCPSAPQGLPKKGKGQLKKKSSTASIAFILYIRQLQETHKIVAIPIIPSMIKLDRLRIILKPILN